MKTNQKQKVCPVCGTEFIPCGQHIYKINRKSGKCVCSYKCRCEYEKAHPKRNYNFMVYGDN
jgi:hypothetical protein